LTTFLTWGWGLTSYWIMHCYSLSFFFRTFLSLPFIYPKVRDPIQWLSNNLRPPLSNTVLHKHVQTTPAWHPFCSSHNGGHPFMTSLPFLFFVSLSFLQESVEYLLLWWVCVHPLFFFSFWLAFYPFFDLTYLIGSSIIILVWYSSPLLLARLWHGRFASFCVHVMSYWFRHHSGTPLLCLTCRIPFVGHSLEYFPMLI